MDGFLAEYLKKSEIGCRVGYCNTTFDTNKILSLKTLYLIGFEQNVPNTKSVDRIESLPDEELDWIFLDRKEDETQIYLNLKAAYSKIKPGGHILGNGFDWVDEKTQDPFIKNALDFFLADYVRRVKILTIHNNQYIIKKV